MPLPNISFIKGQGGLGRALPGEDFISGLIFYTATLPTGYSSSARVKALYSLQDAVNAGILNDYSDATAATGTYLITTLGATGDTFEIKVADIDVNGVAQSTSLGVYTKVAGDSTIALLGASIAAAINAGTINHGYSATFATATLTLTGPKRLGTYLNSGTPISVTIVGTIAGTITQFSGGTLSKLALYHYHVSEFFRIQPKGILYVGFYAIPGTYTFTEITTVQTFAAGKIRQVAVLKDPASAWSSANFTTIQSIIAANDAVYKPLSAVYAAELTGTVDITTIADLAVLSANKVSSCIGQDGGGQGNYLYLTSGKTVGVVGAQLGVISLSKVSESIAWVGQFNMSDGVELEVLAFANGKPLTDLSESAQSALNDKRHIFLKKFVGLSGSWFNDSHTAIVASSDYAYIENNRTIDKAIRGIYASLLPSLNSPLQLNSDGTLRETTIAYFESQAGVNLDAMVRNAELSAYGITIDPAQDVLATSKIIIAVQLIINGVARYIEVPIGFSSKLLTT